MDTARLDPDMTDNLVFIIYDLEIIELIWTETVR